ncbi:unnamed protein product, partial [Didymodactylos carnosus]
MYARIKELTGNKKARSECKYIKDKNGVVLKEPEDIKGRWKEYVEELYDKKGKPKVEDFNMEKEENVGIDEKGPALLEAEILQALEELKNGKAEGVDGISAELLKALGERGKKELVLLCQQIYESGIWPQDYTMAAMVALEKK